MLLRIIRYLRRKLHCLQEKSIVVQNQTQMVLHFPTLARLPPQLNSMQTMCRRCSLLGLKSVCRPVEIVNCRLKRAHGHAWSTKRVCRVTAKGSQFLPLRVSLVRNYQRQSHLRSKMKLRMPSCAHLLPNSSMKLKRQLRRGQKSVRRKLLMH